MFEIWCELSLNKRIFENHGFCDVSHKLNQKFKRVWNHKSDKTNQPQFSNIQIENTVIEWVSQAGNRQERP